MAKKSDIEAVENLTASNLDVVEQSREELEKVRIKRQEGDTRQQIAITFVAGYFALFILILVGVPLYNFAVNESGQNENLIINLEDTLLTFSSVIGAALGFVIGYYFKSRND